MRSDDAEIRTLIERWAKAVHPGDMDGVLADHAADHRDVRCAYAYALLRCAKPEELRKNPGNRLRLTIGLRKESGGWVVAHEHHSFPTTH